MRQYGHCPHNTKSQITEASTQTITGAFTHQWRIVMTTLNRKNTFNPQLFILSAGLLLQAHSAFASDPSNDAQAQARALLDPPVVHQVIAAQGTASSPTKDRTLVYPDAQESARAFLS